MMATTSEHDMESSLKDYDEIPYPGSAFANSHPSHLAAVARICGLNPQPPRKCRVLELGSSMGTNLIPMAESLPESEFVGVDLSARQIEQGSETLSTLDLHNIQLLHRDIGSIDESLGKFDYIICHGVYSWVPREIQAKILRVGSELLNENGILYVSYNTYPGWHLRGAVRDMMRYHVQNVPSAKEKIQQARELLKFLAESARTHFEAYPKLLEQEAKNLSQRSDSYLYHEFLETVNEPLYFHEFLSRVSESGMRYVADAEIRSMMAQVFEENVATLLQKLPILQREQYMDFLRSRAFRMSVLCREEVTPSYNVHASCLRPLHVSLNSPVSVNNEKSGDGKTVWNHARGTLSTVVPMTDVFQMLQSRWPAWTSVEELLDGPLQGTPQEQEQHLKELFVGMLQGVLRLCEDPPYVEPRPTERPMCTRYARWQAQQGDVVTNRRHTDVHCERLTRLVIEHADGQRSHAELAATLQESAASGGFRVTQNDKSVDNGGSVDWLPVLQQELSQLAAGCLLVG